MISGLSFIGQSVFYRRGDIKKMEFPIELRNEIEKLTEKYSVEQLRKTSKSVTDKYKNQSGKGKNLITNEIEAAVYSIVRMTATFGAVYRALEYSFENTDLQIKSVIDIGAGTGAASWAAAEIKELEKIICIEREKAMRDFGKKYMQKGNESLKNAQWISGDILSSEIPDGYDLIISSYVLNEMTESDREKTISRLWEKTEKMLLIIEPGTPEGFRQIKNARSQLIKKGAYIAAPCFHQNECKISENDWCHFSVRIQRSKLHKLIKDADVPYEDEKFSYMSFVKEKPLNLINNSDNSRILRHPVIEKGKIKLTVCSKLNSDCENKEIIITKKDGNLFKYARKSKWGDKI